ncbi:MAG: aminoacyl-tRNA hydrolase [Deltaproteobacteria bacterium]|nr:aminoacyl-tRNA hydrolase [Deltaproteobacteria bacterium]MBW2500199.1 aminoacyl-tRNA hydrolase [Deltaproteobacteria bacterium]
MRSRSASEVGPAPTRLVVGLGNPGARYAVTRHNVGFRIVEDLAEQLGGDWQLDRDLESRVASVTIGDESVLLVEPQTFMNRSGEALEAAFARWPELSPEDLLVVYDDLDLPTGRIRLRPSGGAGGHRGMGDILERLDTRGVPRLRFGIGHPGHASGVLDWVLEPFSEEELRALPQALGRAGAAIEMVIREGITSAMGRFNADCQAKTP